MTVKIPDLQVQKFTTPDNAIPAIKIQEDTYRKFVTDAEKTKITDLPDNTSLQNDLDSKQDALVSGANIKTVNNQSLLGSGDIPINANLDINILTTKSIPNSNDVVVVGDSEVGFQTKKISIGDLQGTNVNEAFTKVGGEVRDDFIANIDIPIDVDTYSKLVILGNTLQNDTNNIRVRGVFLNIEKTELTHTFAWNGLTRSQDNTNTQEYNSALNYFPIAGERTTNGLGIANISTHNIAIQKQDTTNIYINTEYTYKDTANLVVGGFNNTNAIKSIVISYESLQGIYSQSTAYLPSVDISINQSLLKDSSVSTGSATTSSTNQFIQYDLSFSRSVSKISLSSPDAVFPGGFSGGTYTNGCDLQYSNDGLSWTTITTLSGFGTGTSQEFLVSINARYIKIFRTSGYVALSEFTVFATIPENTTLTTIKYLRLFATSGLIKGEFYIYGMQKTSQLPVRTTELKEASEVNEISELNEILELSVQEYA